MKIEAMWQPCWPTPQWLVNWMKIGSEFYLKRWSKILKGIRLSNTIETYYCSNPFLSKLSFAYLLYSKAPVCYDYILVCTIRNTISSNRWMIKVFQLLFAVYRSSLYTFCPLLQNVRYKNTFHVSMNATFYMSIKN